MTLTNQYAAGLHPHQYNGYISRGVDAPDVLVERLDGAVTVMVCNGKNEYVTVRPVD